MVNVMKGGGRAPPTSSAWANFTLMMECAPALNSVYSVGALTGEGACEWPKNIFARARVVSEGSKKRYRENGYFRNVLPNIFKFSQ